MLSPLLSAHYEKIIAVPTEKPRLWKILQSPKLERNALPTVELHPGTRTWSFAVSHTRLVALPWGLRLAVERRRHAPHQHKSELDSRLRWKSRKGLQLGKRLPGTQHRVGFVEFPAEGC